VNGHFEDANAGPDGLAPWSILGKTKRSEKDVTAWDGEHYAILTTNQNGGPALYTDMGGPPPSRRGLLQTRGTDRPNGELIMSCFPASPVRHLPCGATVVLTPSTSQPTP
jgi:hypothetical protein